MSDGQEKKKKSKEKQQLLCDCEHSDTSKVEINEVTDCVDVCGIIVAYAKSGLWEAANREEEK